MSGLEGANTAQKIPVHGVRSAELLDIAGAAVCGRHHAARRECGARTLGRFGCSPPLSSGPAVQCKEICGAAVLRLSR